MARVSSRGNNERVNAGGGFWYVLSAAALGWDALGSARTWAALLLPPPKGLANIPRAGRTPPALLLFLSSIYVFFFFSSSSSFQSGESSFGFLRASLSLSLFPVCFFFPSPCSWSAASVSQGRWFICRRRFRTPAQQQAGCLRAIPGSKQGVRPGGEGRRAIKDSGISLQPRKIKESSVLSA